MDLPALILTAVLIIGITIPIVWYWPMSRVAPRDERTDDGVDAAASLAVEELRKRGQRRP